ncbi:MAG: hypothetical protein ACRCTR_07180 [Actinomycetota bacterium]
MPAIAAITGQSLPEVEAAFHQAKRQQSSEHHATTEEVQQMLNLLSTRLGLAPAVNLAEARGHREALSTLIGDNPAIVTRSDLSAWTRMLRQTPEHVPTLNRTAVLFPLLPRQQTEMWKTLLDLESTQSKPWVLVGGQMTILHCLENDFPAIRATNDGDVVVGVWSHRDALMSTSRFLRGRKFAEVKTNDGFGYRYKRDETVIDVMIPEGLERQHTYPKTMSGRRGFATEGGRQALARAERVPIQIEEMIGYVRRPSLLGAIVAKAHAYVVDNRDPERHAQDLVTLANIALKDPRATLQQAQTNDRKPVRRALRTLPLTHRVYRGSDNLDAIHAFLTRLASP